MRFANYPQTSHIFMTVGQINNLIFEIFALPLLTFKDLKYCWNSSAC